MATKKEIVLSPKCHIALIKGLREVAKTVHVLDLELQKLVKSPQPAFVLIAGAPKKRSRKT